MSLRAIALGLGAAFGLSYATTGSFWPFGGKKDDGPPPPVGYDAIEGTSIVDLSGVGKVRFFNPDVNANVLQNLAGAYIWDEEGVFKPLVGQKFTWIQHYDPVGYPSQGARAFDWAVLASQQGFYVLMPANSGSGPWSQVDGNNKMLAATAADLTNMDVVNDWAIVAEPYNLPVTYLTTPTETLLTELGKG